MKKPKFPVCPICGEAIEAPHESCQNLRCAICNKPIPNLNHFITTENYQAIFRFCSLECEKAYSEKEGILNNG